MPNWISRVEEILNAPLITISETPLTLGKVAGLLLLLMVAFLVVKLIERALKRLTRPGRRVSLTESAVYALSRIVSYIVWVVVIMVGLDYVGLNLSNLALIGGAIGVGIGFGLQNIVANFISGIVLLLEQTLKVGDFVDLQSGVMGKVSEINIRYTRVTTNDLEDVIVPNSEFINGRVTNWTFNENLRRVHVPFGVAYGTDKELVKRAGLAAAATVEGCVIDAAHPADVWLVGFGDSSLDFELVVWVGPKLVKAPGKTKAQFLWALETELRRSEIEIPFPQRDLHIRSGSLTASTKGDG